MGKLAALLVVALSACGGGVRFVTCTPAGAEVVHQAQADSVTFVNVSSTPIRVRTSAGIEHAVGPGLPMFYSGMRGLSAACRSSKPARLEVTD